MLGHEDLFRQLVLGQAVFRSQIQQHFFRIHKSTSVIVFLVYLYHGEDKMESNLLLLSGPDRSLVA